MEALVRYNATQTFPYEPITEPDGIRLLILYPAKLETAEICCSLVHTSLSQYKFEVIDHFTALSYVWGDASIVTSIWIDGAQFQVTVNLHKALLHMRDTSRLLRVWADAICINQNNNDEKNLQVRMMRKIYAAADHTIIFLGIPVDDDGRSRDVPNGSIRPDLAREMLLRPWFRRVWIFQELVFSRDPWVQYGRRRWQWDHFGPVLQQIMDGDGISNGNSKLSSASITNSVLTADQAQATCPAVSLSECFALVLEMQAARQLYRDQGQGADMMTLALARRGLGVTDPRDMIFAHTGFASDGEAELLRVDYSKQYEKVCIDFAMHQIRKDNCCRLLFHVDGGNAPSREVQLPSWVPDWTKPQAANLEQFQCPVSLKYSWAPGPAHLDDKARRARWSLQVCVEDPPTLLVLGCRREEVVGYSVPLSYEQIPTEDRARLLDRFAKIKLRRSEDLIDAICVEAYMDMYNAWRRVINDDTILPELKERPTYQTSPIAKGFYGRSIGPFPDFKHLGRSYQWGQDGSRMPIRDTVADCLIAAFDLESKKSFLEGRRLARFSSGVLALVPASVQLGDFVIYTEKEPNEREPRSWFREPFLLRPCPRLQNPLVDAHLRSKAQEQIDLDSQNHKEKSRLHNEKSYFHEDGPILTDINSTLVEHCTFLGPTFVHGLEYFEAPCDRRICDEAPRDATEEADIYNRRRRRKNKHSISPQMIYAIH